MYVCPFIHLIVVISQDPGTFKIKLVPVLGGENFGRFVFLTMESSI